MNWYCAGNGQLNQISMTATANTLDCMHDQQIVIGEEIKWKSTLRLRVHYALTATPGATLGRMRSTTCFLSSRILRGGVLRLRLTQATTKEQEQEMETKGNTSATKDRKYVLRRLTPLECLRLQGLPDWWCDGANGSDSAIYKMAGNGLAIPCAYNVLQRIATELSGEE